jgi:ABC-type sugar transport system ATPase subunit
MKGVVKEFSGVRVLHGVDFDLLTGEVMALMGENGAGKSTLMKVLCGVHQEWKGEIRIEGVNCKFRRPKEAENAGISIIHQELNLIPYLSVAENIFLGREPLKRNGFVDYKKMKVDAERLLEQLEFTSPVTMPVENLRVGHQQLVEIAKALSVSARILIMDEPTSALSDNEVEILFSVIRHLKSQGISIIYISHRMSEIFEIADRVTVLRDGKTIDVVKTSSTTRRKLIQMMVGRSFEQFFVKECTPGKKMILSVKNLTRTDPEKKQKVLIDNITFDLKQGEILGIAGLLGAGRTELLESLFGAAEGNTSGELHLDGKLLQLPDPQSAISAGISLITEDRKGNGLVMGMSIANNLSLAALDKIVEYDLFISRNKEKQLASSYIDDLSIDTKQIGLPIDILSGGNQQKVMLAKWLTTDPKVLLLDDPTRGIDVGAKYDIYVLLSELANKGISIIMSSSELPELLTLCDRIIVLREGQLSKIFNQDEATQEKILDAAAPMAVA